MSLQSKMLGVIIFVPGVMFAIANSTASSGDASPASQAVAAIAISGAIGGAVALRPNRKTLWVALAWSAFSVVFELTQAHKHQNDGATARMYLSLVLAVIRTAGVAGSARLLK